MQISKNILIAPLNWGLGHAARCMPIITRLLDQGHQPIIASDGQALALLKHEYPQLPWIELPSYDVEYPENGDFMRLKMLKDSPKLWRAMRKEHKLLAELIEDYNLDGIISDNRLGLYHDDVPTVIITHQLQVLSGSTTWLSTQLHQHFIKKFDFCWVPDYAGDFSLSGRLSSHDDPHLNTTFIGPLSRLHRCNTPSKYDLLVLLSGPEPQRAILEKKLLDELIFFQGKVLFIRGVVEGESYSGKKNGITTYNFLTAAGIQKAMARSSLILCRSGYSSILDLAAMGNKAFFIPTPGQYEQEYLAEHMENIGIAPYRSQMDFQLSDLSTVNNYAGFDSVPSVSSTSLDVALDEAFSSVKLNSEPIPGSLST